MTEALAWPPTKQDLERLYLADGLSAAKIADVYALNNKNPKVAESTVLYHLKKNGIERRDPAQHTRKVSVEMGDEWVARYLTGESLKQIAEDLVSPVTVWNHLKARGVFLRDKVEAQIKAVTKYERRPFSGDRIEGAYLMGLRYGDLHVVRHGRAIRVRVSTTHPAMANLFEMMFSPYGFVHRYPRKAKLVRYEWTLECDLDISFEFLLVKPTVEELSRLRRRELLAFLAGLFDAEGSIFLHDKGGRKNPEACYTNGDPKLILFLERSLLKLGFNPRKRWTDQPTERRGVSGSSKICRVYVWRFEDAQRFMSQIPFKHLEKIAKSRIALRLEYGDRASDDRLGEEWKSLGLTIKRQRNEFVAAAKEKMEGLAPR